MPMHQAQDTFVAEMADGSVVRVGRGEVFHDSHELVKRDAAGSGMLFKQLGDDGPPDPKRPSRPRARVAAQAQSASADSDGES